MPKLENSLSLMVMILRSGADVQNSILNSMGLRMSIAFSFASYIWKVRFYSGSRK